MNNSSLPNRQAQGQTARVWLVSLASTCYLTALLTLPCVLQAQPTAHYPPGIHGINAGTLPPPGLYLRDYNLFYTSDHLNGPTGDRTGPANFDAFTYANIIRPIWITDLSVLGGYLGADVVVPLVYRSLRAGSFDDNSFNLGDFLAEATLSWHLKQFDFCIGAGEWMPTGESAPKPTTRAGLGFWTTMFTFGGTWFIDPDRTWSVAALNRYEINNTKQPDTHTTTGNAWTIEWGLGKAFNKSISAGVVGYYQAKVTGDTGTNPQPLNRVAAIGPEFDLGFPAKLLLQLRYDYEFLSDNRAQGHTVSLVLTKRLW